MIPVSPDALDSDWIRSLVDNGIPESTWLEYKSELPGKSDDDKKGFLKEVTALANTVGGVVLYGVMEKKDGDGQNTGTPQAVNGVGSPNRQAVESWMNNLIRDAVDPRIEGIRYKWISYDGGKELLAVWVPSSWQAPHMIIFKSWRRFYGRTSTSAEPLSVDQIRSIVLGRDEVPERIRAFHFDRIDKVRCGDTPVRIQKASYFVMHVVPINEFMGRGSVHPKEIYPRSNLTGFTSRPNLDGSVSWAFLGESETTNGYRQVFRNGSVETVESWWLGRSLADEKPTVSGPELREAIEASRDIATELAKRRATYPMMLMVSLIGVNGYEIRGVRQIRWRDDLPKAFDRDVVTLPDRLLRGDDSDSLEPWGRPRRASVRVGSVSSPHLWARGFGRHCAGLRNRVSGRCRDLLVFTLRSAPIDSGCPDR